MMANTRIDPNAAHAARLLGISYVAAVTGFSFRGRHGTAVINGVVIAQEYLEALQAVLSGLEDQVQRELEERRTKEALRMWKRFLVALRVKERIDAYAVEGEDGDERVQEVVEEEMQEVDDNDEGMTSEEYFDDGEGGGFFPE
jgi:xeroderma pigmentosum group C-complementing protein